MLVLFECIFVEIAEMLPGILNQLGAESLSNLKKLANSVAGGKSSLLLLSLVDLITLL